MKRIAYIGLFYSGWLLADVIKAHQAPWQGKTPTVAVANLQSYLMVKGIENWIQQLQGLPDKDKKCSPAVMMKDIDTGATFAIRRIK